MLTAKLLVAAGAPLQLSAGETLPPLQPKPLNTCSLTMVAPSLISELVKVMLCALAKSAPKALKPSAANQTGSFVAANFVIAIPLSMSRDFSTLVRLGQPIAIFAAARKAAAVCLPDCPP